MSKISSKTTDEQAVDGVDGVASGGTLALDATATAVNIAQPTAGGKAANVSARLDQWADGPVSQGDVDGTGKNQEGFVNGNLNAQKAHYNEGDAIPYRAILDDLTPGVVYGLQIQWDTVDSGKYALDYLTSYNFAFDGARHPGEPDVTPTAGVNDLSSGIVSTIDIPADPQLTTGFGANFGITDGLSSGQPSGQQYITLFGNVDVNTLSTSGISYTPDLTKASITVFFTYTGSAADNADSVVLAWGGHIAASNEWSDDAGETVQTASSINGSPYHMRLVNLSQDGVVTSLGNQDRSLSADAVVFIDTTPTAGTQNVQLDDDALSGGIAGGPGDVDPDTANTTGTLPHDYNTNGAGSTLLTGASSLPGGFTQTLSGDGLTLTIHQGTTDVLRVSLADAIGGAYTVTHLAAIAHPTLNGVAGDNTENNLQFTVGYRVTDIDGDFADGTLNIDVDDDTPTISTTGTLPTLTVDETNLASDDSKDFSGNFTSAYGADGAGTLSYALGINAGSTGLVDTATGENVVLSLTGGGVVEGRTATTNLLVFAVSVASDGTATLDQKRAIVHDDPNNPDDSKTLASANLVTLTATISDRDDDTQSATHNIGDKLVFKDDGPTITSITNLFGFNTSQPLAGTYNFSVGADPVGNAAANGVVLQSFTGTVDGNAITDASVVWAAEDATSVTFDFSFKYLPGPTSTVQQTATGSVVFNKTDGTYTFDLDAEIGAQITFSTSAPQASFNYDTLGNNSPEIVVQQYASNFFGVLSAQAAVPPSDSTDLVTSNNDNAFVAGETFKSVATSYVNVSTATVGVDSDTIQNGELLNYDFYTANPVIGAVSPPQNPSASIDPNATRAYADSLSITLDQITAGEDIAVLLKLYNANTDQFDTKLLIANNAADYQTVGSFKVVNITAGNYDSANYQIYGVQIISSTENLTGSGFSLTGNNPVTLTSAGSNFADTADNDVMKIIKIDVTTKTANAFDTDLNFVGKLVDGDGDSAGFNFSVHLEADSQILTGSIAADALTGTNADEQLIGGAGKDIQTGGGGADQFKYVALTDSLLANFDVITDYSSNDAIDASGLVTAGKLETSVGMAASLSATDVADALGALAANTAAAFQVDGEDGIFVVLNDGTAGFQADSDAIIQLPNLGAIGTNPVEIV